MEFTCSPLMVPTVVPLLPWKIFMTLTRLTWISMIKSFSLTLFALDLVQEKPTVLLAMTTTIAQQPMFATAEFVKVLLCLVQVIHATLLLDLVILSLDNVSGLDRSMELKEMDLLSVLYPILARMMPVVSLLNEELVL
jgi:hypothetical protein